MRGVSGNTGLSDGRGLLSVSRLRQWLGELIANGAGDAGESTRISWHALALTRWVAITGQLFTILFVHFSLGIPLPLGALLPAVALSILINFALALIFGSKARFSEPVAGMLFSFDILQLGYLLWMTGGIQNPFSVLLLVPVALAAGLLGERWTLVISGLALAITALISLDAGALPWHPDVLTLPALYRLAAWAALSISTTLVAVYAWRFAQDARQHARALAATQLALMREQQMSALGSQAAAAAHLLGSPLGTIAIVAKELVRELPRDHPLYADVEEIVAQTGRCREILATLGQRKDDGALERLAPIPFSTAIAEIAEPHRRSGIALEIHTESLDDTPEPMVSLPPEIRHALANLIDNAVRFARHRVDLTLRIDREGVELSIEDDGPGFSPEVLDWLGEPYLSGRHKGEGLGLGIFIANTLLARTGATIRYDNTSQGARVRLRWPSGALQRAMEENADEPGST